MKVAAIQYGPDRSDRHKTLADVAKLANNLPVGTELLVLPELIASPYNLADNATARAYSEKQDGVTFQACAAIAKEHHTFVVVGYLEDGGESLYNSALVINPDGQLIHNYRKTLLFEIDERWATPGDTPYPLIQTPSGSFTVGICMDINDPRFIRWVNDTSPTAIAFPTNWVAEGIPVWSYWAWMLQHTSATLVAADVWGSEAGITYAGQSAILHRTRVLAGLGPTLNALITADI